MVNTDKTYTAIEYEYLENDYKRISGKYEREFERRRSWEKKYSELLSEKNQLILELDRLKSQPPRKHNERGAGRKTLATHEQVNEIIHLHNDGISHSQILKRLNLSWSKGTIRNIIVRYQQTKEGLE